MKTKKRYLIVKMTTYSQEFVGDIETIAGPFDTKKDCNKAWRELCGRYEDDEDAEVGDYEISIDDGQDGCDTIKILEFSDPKETK